jgi:4-amino-4-deoxy-L-arabinose transferase-like glycosyltransferase
MIINETKNKYVFIKILIILSILIIHLSRINDTPPNKGAHGDNFIYSYNLAKYNVFSKSKIDSNEVIGDSYFLPLIPIINYPILRLDKDLKKKNINCYLERNTDCDRSILKYMKLYNFISLVFLTYFAYSFSKKFFNKNICFFITLIFLSGSWYYNILNSFKHELLASALFLGWTLYRIKFIQKKKIKYLIYIGISVGLLILTRSIFILLILIEAYFYLKSINKKNYLKRLTSLFLIFLLITPWNLYQKSITQKNDYVGFDLRSGKIGKVMSIRAEKNQMNHKEYIGGFLYFSPSGGMTILKSFFNYDYYEKWDRDNPISFHKKMMLDDNYISTRLKNKNMIQNDKNLIKESLRSFLEKPIKHFFTSILFMYRGFWPDATDRPSLFYAFFSFIIFLYFYFLKFFDKEFRKNNLETLIILFPCIFSILFHSVFTHYQPRYSIPIMAPILIFFSGNVFKYIFFKFNK